MRLVGKNGLPWTTGKVIWFTFEKVLWFGNIGISDDFGCRFRSLRIGAL